MAQAFDPKTDKFPYPKQTDKHYLIIKKNRGINFDENYPYVDKSRSFSFKRFIIGVLLNVLVFPFIAIRTGLKIKGKKNLKKNKELLKNGAISVANHVHMCDYICVMNALKPRKTHILSWAPNVNEESGPLVRLVGGIPIPEGSFTAYKAFMNSVGDLLNDGGWLHVCPEGSMWEYYRPIRPFKSGAAEFACMYDKPIIPMGFSYRKPGFIRRKIFGQIALITLNIGEPLFPDKSLPKYKRVEDLTKRSFEAVCGLCGIDPKENLYPAIFDNNERIDYYTDSYGAGYKGSK